MRRASNCMASLLLLSAALLPATLEGAVCKSEYKNAPGGLVHTACKPPNRRCKITSSGLSSSKKTEFLKAHNDYRMKVAKGDLPNFPKAADMQKLIWDDELAEVAQALADQCTVSNGGIKHDKYDERFTVKFKQVGQNLGWAAASFDDPDVDVIGQVTRWFNEYQYFNPAGIHSLRHQSGPAVGHFTQVIWAATEAVGCGMARYTLQNDRSGTPYQKLYVCNYGPGGNVARRPIYEAGEPCSKCPQETTCQREMGLCASPHDSGGFGASSASCLALITVALMVVALPGAG